MEASKDALETELQQQKDALASLEENLQEQKQLAEAQQEAKVALEAKLQETVASETALKSEIEATNEASSALEAKFLESQALETSLTRELQQSKEAETASIQLKNQLMSQLQNADERVSILTVDLTAAQDWTQGGSRMERIECDSGLESFSELTCQSASYFVVVRHCSHKRKFQLYNYDGVTLFIWFSVVTGHYLANAFLAPFWRTDCAPVRTQKSLWRPDSVEIVCSKS